MINKKSLIINLLFYGCLAALPTLAQTTTTTATITLASSSAYLQNSSVLSFTLFLYLLISTVYILTIYLAVGVKSQFQLFLFIGFFIFGGVLGAWLKNYETGLVVAIILSLIFW